MSAGNDLTLNATIDGGGSLQATAGDELRLGGNIGKTVALDSITLTASRLHTWRLFPQRRHHPSNKRYCPQRNEPRPRWPMACHRYTASATRWTSSRYSVTSPLVIIRDLHTLVISR